MGYGRAGVISGKRVDPYYLSPEWKALRRATLERDGSRCVACGDPASIADHIIRRRDGGADTLSNLRSLCRICDNRVKEGRAGKRGRMGILGVVGADGWPIA